MAETGIPGMGEIYQLGHKAVEGMFDSPVEITEKVDGSFFSFAVLGGELRMRSKGQALHKDAPSSKMFLAAMQEVEDRRQALVEGWIYRGEYLAKPKHNSLHYERVPQGHVALFDIEVGPGDHADDPGRRNEAGRLGFSTVPLLYEGVVPDNPSGLTIIRSFLERDSYLGGTKIEGMVIKNYTHYVHGHVAMVKLVSEEFKEVHKKEWKVGNPGGKDIVESLIETYRTEPRWLKAVQHLRDNGSLDTSLRDIGPLLKEVAQDVRKEEEESIKDALFKWAWPKLSRGIGAGLPDWYKQELANEQFAEEGTPEAG